MEGTDYKNFDIVVNKMREKFETISEGGYANILYSQFGKD